MTSRRRCNTAFKTIHVHLLSVGLKIVQQTIKNFLRDRNVTQNPGLLRLALQLRLRYETIAMRCKSGVIEEPENSIGGAN